MKIGILVTLASSVGSLATYPQPTPWQTPSLVVEPDQFCWIMLTAMDMKHASTNVTTEDCMLVTALEARVLEWSVPFMKSLYQVGTDDSFILAVTLQAISEPCYPLQGLLCRLIMVDVPFILLTRSTFCRKFCSPIQWLVSWIPLSQMKSHLFSLPTTRFITISGGCLPQFYSVMRILTVTTLNQPHYCLSNIRGKKKR